MAAKFVKFLTTDSPFDRLESMQKEISGMKILHVACFFNHESTKSEAIVKATTKGEQKRGNTKL